MRRQRRRIAFHRISLVALAEGDTLLKRWLPGGQIMGEEYLAHNPKRVDRRLGSFRINQRSGRWADFALTDASGGDLISLAAYLFNLSQSEAALRLAAALGIEAYDHA